MLNLHPDPYDILLNQIDSIARVYFEELFRKEQKIITKFSKLDKLEGRHIGILLSIDYILQSDNTQHTITYYIKVHNQGPQWENISLMKPADPREIFVYNVLSLTGYGAKAHFFFLPDNHDVLCIATQDVSFTKRQDRNKTFIAGSSKEFSELLIKYKQQMLKLLNTVELLQYILLLGDILQYADNFGIVTIPEGSKLKIIDFAVSIPKESQRSTFSSDLFGVYIAKSNLSRYNKCIDDVLYLQANSERTKNARLCQQEFSTGKPRISSDEAHMSLAAAINTSQKITERFLHCGQNDGFLYYLRLIDNNLKYFMSLQF